MATAIARYLSLTTLQGSADAFVQASVATGLVPADGFAFKVLAVDIVFESSFAQLSADGSIFWSLTRDTKTALPRLSDPDVMFKDGYANALTTSGEVWVPQHFHYEFPDGLYIVEPTIYAQLDGNSTGFASDADWRVYYEEVKLSEVEILRLLNNV